MAWVAFDRAVKLIERCNCAARDHLERWRKIRDEIHAQVCAQGYNATKKAFTQFYGSEELDASLLMMPLVGFLPATDERVRHTIEAVERELMEDGFVLRYRPEENNVDGLPGSGRRFSALLVLAGRLSALDRPHRGRAQSFREITGSAE